jgi:hypothetical protein
MGRSVFNSSTGTRAQRRVTQCASAAGVVLALLVSSCGETDEPEVTPQPPGAAPGVPTSDGGLSTTPSPALPGNTPGTNPGPTQPGSNPTPATPTDAGAGPSTPSTNTDTQWCKVKAVLDKNCVACHKTPAVGGAPFPLTTHAELTAAHPMKQGKKVYERVALRVHADLSDKEGLGVMPPGKPMSAADIALIDQWAAAGAQAGENPSCAGGTTSTGDGGTPPTKAWPPAECDAVYKITSHGAGGIDTPNMAVPGRESHPQVAWDAPWGTEQVQAIAFRSITDNAAVLHHWILSARPGGMIFGWAPGEEEIQGMQADVGMLMPTGPGSLNLDMHYYNTNGTKAEPDKSGVEVCVVKKAKFRKNNAGIATRLAPFAISIPPNAKGYEAKASCTVGGSQPITLLNASPHAHKLAKRMIFTLKRKSGELITMHDGPFMFGEQGTYELNPPLVVQPGDVINTTCVFDNPSNRTVTFGESTDNEMCFNFAMYYPSGALTCSAAPR